MRGGEVRTGLYRSGVSRRRDGRSGRQSRQLGDAAVAARRADRATRRKAPICWSSKAPWACSTACPARPAARARPPISPRVYGLPVLLVLDVSGQSQSAAAVAAGFATYDPEVRVAGVVLNKLGSERHRTLIARCARCRFGMPVVGAIPRDDTLVLPERHLGLVQASEHADLAARLDAFRRHGRTLISISTPSWRWLRLLPCAGNRAARAAAARPAHRAGVGRRLHLRLSARARWLAPGRRGDRAVLAAADEAAAGRLRCLLAAGRLSGTARRPPRGGAPFSGRLGAVRADTRRCMASAAATWCSAKAWRTPRALATPWRACSATRQASPSASCTSAIGRRGCWPTIRSARWRRRARPRIPPRVDYCERQRRAVRRCHRCAGPAGRGDRQPARPGVRHVLPRHRPRS